MQEDGSYETGYVEVDQNGRITACTDEMIECFNLPYDQVVGANISEHVPVECYSIFKEFVHSADELVSNSTDNTRISSLPSVQVATFQSSYLKVSFKFLRKQSMHRTVMAMFTYQKNKGLMGSERIKLLRKEPFHSTPKLTLQNKYRKYLEQANIEKEFVIHYQPQIDLASGEIVGMEALLRWNQPTLGVISPTQFIPLAEETGHIHALSEWVLEQACRQNKQFQEDGYQELKVAVNISTVFLQNDHFIECVQRVLDQTQLDPRFLELELTESFFIQNVGEATDKLNQLRAMGVRVALDDFGKGYSSLHYLKHLSIDTLKIDREFVKELSQNRYDRYISTTIINLAHHLNMNVVAEGVETVEQLEFLKSKSCNGIQGYLFSRPVLAADFVKLLA
ncbi:putative bifunctional diguanylate cyclase/phosphodiesterase [Bacillus horti]|uniref:EAL domain-containing protein (Putative c-di-GMP-specific phosphodiesterase class I) n=1 Tax=Caldalkalibacillus horti TaxID=77523 RepID=A0ABT9VXX2_9BACI|nr:EAL domain-containing protein [Bacillus horti]MDQ0165662.1 EAL domain-containing protein (putative c-di-GMP-specific phosphodiesterase class I) [Bacillus horti]